jgi:hypothetical protein
MDVSGSRHERSAIEAFLDDEFRQVWAADRATGEPRFLPDGQAAELRAVAKAQWRCPVPDCAVEITTVGGTNRRHHFRHNQPAPHASDGESEFHLAAKAMLAAWAQERLPVNASVQEERSTTKDPRTSRYRIADVMVTWEDHRQTAFEVEYKNYAPEDWELKQSDYDSHEPTPIPCVWLLGHLRVKRPPKNSYMAEEPEIVRIPRLGQKWIASGRPLLAINPVTRQIGTFLSEHKWDEPKFPAPGDTYGRLHVDALEDCVLDYQRGIVTPAMRRVEKAETRRREAEQRRVDEENRRKAERERRVAYYEDLRRKQCDTWEATDLFKTFNERWGTVPALLATLPGDPIDQSGVWAHPSHWRGAIYEELIHPFALGPQPTLEDQMLSGALLPARQSSSFNFHDIQVALSVHEINTHQRDPKKAYKTVLEFMERLHKWQVLAIHRDRNNRATHFEPTGYPLVKAETDYQNRRRQNEAATRATDTQRIADMNRARAQHDARQLAARELATRRADARRVLEANRACAEYEARARREQQRAHTTTPQPDQRQPTGADDRSRCSRCEEPLPSWQRGGYHTAGCPTEAEQSSAS